MLGDADAEVPCILTVHLKLEEFCLGANTYLHEHPGLRKISSRFSYGFAEVLPIFAEAEVVGAHKISRSGKWQYIGSLRKSNTKIRIYIYFCRNRQMLLKFYIFIL